MDDDRFDDSFSDDGIDELPPGTLLALEQNAYQASQQQRPDSNNGYLPPKPKNPSFVSLARESTSRPSSRTSSRGPILQDPSRLHRPPLSFGDEDFQDLDAGVLDDGYGPAPVELEDTVLEQGKAQGREPGFRPDRGRKDVSNGQWHPPGEGRVPGGGHHAVSVGDTIIMSGMETTANAMHEDSVNGPGPDPGVWAEIEVMREQIEQLTRDRERMAQEAAAAKSMAEAKAGEIAIIRSNQTKLEKAHNRQLSALRSAMAEETNKHQAEIDAAAADSRMLTTENAFLKQDLKEEAQRLNDLRKAKARAEETPAPATPRKTRVLPLRDGFDDDEMMPSPTKSAGRRSKRGTPSVPGGRKRKAMDDSPVKAPALELTESFEINMADGPDAGDPMAIDSTLQDLKREDRNVRYIRRILNHKTYPDQGRDLEIFTKLSFPSEPGRMFSSFILENTTTKFSENYAVEYARAIISLWSRALKERFFEPIDMFMAIIRFIINLDPPTIVPQLIVDLIPVLQESGYVNGIPRVQASPVSHLNLGQVKQTPQSELNHQVNSTEALNILYLAASSLQHDYDSLRKFWQNILYEFILVMLNSYQLIDDIIITLNLLSYSIFPTTFGPLLNTEAKQTANENYIIDRVANLLSEQPHVDEGEKPYTPWQISTLRAEAMSFLTQLAFSAPHPDLSKNPAGRKIATHPTVLARVFRSLHDELDALYSHPPERELHLVLVNGLTRLAYGIMRTFRDEVNLPAKLRVVPGATQKHLVALTRLAFWEGPLLEAGIEYETVEMAHEMLEEAVNPQEAEALLEAFRVKSPE
ncbi:hypothetical protein FQN55_006125 [Onygenales sp. PD_40]|nr:hypothetical protein FQN55_006125 [Onygenales sp. PD_40]KAK2778309.1 hypothetical protein FQN53_001834 [Emmonsiellopsis sp. PD_33]KAK2795466.1 hypothetical protein FQN52_005233 [Onygenales sp. PD_12]